VSEINITHSPPFEYGGEEIMNSQVLGLRVSGTVFVFMSAAQLARFIMRIEVVVAGYTFPLWPSAFAFIILSSLSLWLWKLAGKKTE
jgi:hypothetical protein